MKAQRRIAILLVSAAVAVLCGLAIRADDEGEPMVTAPTTTESVRLVYEAINADLNAIKPILERSCFDCHSRFTHYPWYHQLPLISSMLDDHIKEGREHLDMSDGFPFTGNDPPDELLTDMKHEIEEGEMPLWSYRLVHWGISIEGERRDSVFAWIDSTLVRLDRLSHPAGR